METSAWIASLNAGLLPKWQLLVAVISIANSIQVYVTTQYAARVYPGTATRIGPISKSIRSLFRNYGSSSGRTPSRPRSRSSRKSAASPPPAHSTRSKTPGKPLPPADEPVSSPDTAATSPSPNTSVVRARAARSASPVTPFAARMFGNWTFLSGVVRVYCALNITNPVAYQLTLWTYVIVCTHLVLEAFVYGTTGPAAGRAIVGSAIIGPSSLVWMLLQWDYYVK